MHNNVENFVIFGKSIFTGREEIWADAFDKIIKFPFIGSGTVEGYNFAGETTMQSAHNTLIDLLKVFGIIPTLIFVYFFVGTKDKIKTKYKVNRVNQIAIIVGMLIMFFESFVTEQHLFVLYVIFLLNKIKVKEKGEENDN